MLARSELDPCNYPTPTNEKCAVRHASSQAGISRQPFTQGFERDVSSRSDQDSIGATCLIPVAAKLCAGWLASLIFKQYAASTSKQADHAHRERGIGASHYMYILLFLLFSYSSFTTLKVGGRPSSQLAHHTEASAQQGKRPAERCQQRIAEGNVAQGFKQRTRHIHYCNTNVARTTLRLTCWERSPPHTATGGTLLASHEVGC